MQMSQETMRTREEKEVWKTSGDSGATMK